MIFKKIFLAIAVILLSFCSTQTSLKEKFFNLPKNQHQLLVGSSFLTAVVLAYGISYFFVKKIRKKGEKKEKELKLDIKYEVFEGKTKREVLILMKIVKTLTPCHVKIKNGVD